ncbi:MAG: hypothetical protein WCI49_13375 [Ferruginibacter sp.]
MKSLLTKGGKFISGLILFTLGLGLAYGGCKYMNSDFNGVIKKIDTIIYIICFIPSVYGLSLIIDALGWAKTKEEKKDPAS